MNHRMRTFWRINHDGQVQAICESKRLSKLFSSFDLSSVQISFVGLIGDFAVWAITDLTTGDVEYIIDDSGGSIGNECLVFNRNMAPTSRDFTCIKPCLRPNYGHSVRTNGVFWVNAIEMLNSYFESVGSKNGH